MTDSGESVKAAEEALRFIRAGQHINQVDRQELERREKERQWCEAEANDFYNQAYVCLLTAYGKLIFQDCDTLLGADGTEEIFRDVFLAARQGMPTFRGKNNIPSLIHWLRTIARNLCLKELKRRQPQVEMERKDLERVADIPRGRSIQTSGSSKWWEDLPEEALRQGIKKLNDAKDKYILRMSMCQEIKIQEIADILDMKEPAVRQRIHRARIELKAILGL